MPSRTPPLAAGDVLVRVAAAGVNPVDVGNLADPSWAGVDRPHQVGYELCGVVVEAPPEADLTRGDRVWGLLPVRGTRWGTHAATVAVPVPLLAIAPEELSDAEAGCLPLAGTTALQALDRLRLPSGARVLVTGAGGGVGDLLVQLAGQQGLAVTAVAAPRDHERLRGGGATRVVDRHDPDGVRIVTQQDGRFDAVVDLVGEDPASLLPAVEDGGQLVAVAALAGDFDEAVDRNLTLHGVLVRPGRDHLTRLAHAVSRGLRPRVAATYPLGRAAEAYARLAAGGVGGRLVITPQA